MLCCQWVLYSSYVKRPKTIIASLAILDQMSKDVTDPLRADEKFMIPNLSLSHSHFVPTHPSNSCFWSGSDRCEEHFATYLLPQILFGFLMEVGEFYTGSWFPIVHISHYCAGWNQEKSTEYMEVQILDYLFVRMRQQPEDVDHLRCSPTKTLR